MVTITIRGNQGALSFSPNPTTVPAGTPVRWRNTDAVAHTATHDGGFFSTGVIAPGQTSAPITIDVPATFTYHCALHLTDIGTLVVTR